MTAPLIRLLVLVLLLAGCTATNHFAEAPPAQRQHLLSGTALPYSAEIPDYLPDSAILALTPDMTSFVDDNVSKVRDTKRRLTNLLRAMTAAGLLSLNYDTSVTLTAKQAFEQRAGNCLAFSNMMVALARHADLKAGYQFVEVPPSWSYDDNAITTTLHINVVIENPHGEEFELDFNAPRGASYMPKHSISDTEAFAHYYNNLGAAAFARRDYPTAFAYYRKALESYPDAYFAWVNLGLLYARAKRDQEAEQAYLISLALQPKNPSVHTNLVSLYQRQGRAEDEQRHVAQVQAYRNKNPYFHYAVARGLRDIGQYEKSLAALEKALAIKQEKLFVRFKKELLELQASQG